MTKVYHGKDISNYSFLVTGGAGFIGSHVAEYLLKHHAGKVRVVDNLSNGFESNLNILSQYDSFEFIEGDIRNIETCRQACEGIDYVSHQAALGSVPRSVKEPFNTNDVNVGGFVNILNAAVEKNIKQFVYASSSSVYGDEPSLPKQEEKTGNCLSPYAVSKKADELYAGVFAKLYGIPVLGFRYFNIFGPRQDPDGPYAAVVPIFIKSIMSNKPAFINGNGEQTRDFTFVENAVQANIKGLLADNDSAKNKVYNIAVGESYSVNFLYNAIKRNCKSNIEPVYGQARSGDIRNSLADISLAKKLLGYEPAVTFEEGLEQTIKFFKSLHAHQLS